jgi:hypothetical protein
LGTVNVPDSRILGPESVPLKLDPLAMAFAVIVPVPVGARLAPLPTTKAAEVFVPPVTALQATLPTVPPLVPHENACVESL